MKSFEYKGLWWFPEKEEPPLIGTLSFDPENGGKLELTEPISDHSQPPSIRFSRNYDIIFGAAGGAQVTLRGCYLLSERRPVPDLRVFGFSVTSVHMNRQMANAEEQIHEESSLSYSQLSLSYTHLNEWLGPVGFVDDGGSYRSERFKPIEVELPETNDKLTFWLGSSRSESATELSMKNKARITIKRNDHSHFSNYRWYTEFSLSSLLTLATGEPNFPSNVVATTKDGVFRTDIFYKSEGYVGNPKPVYGRDMLFTAHELGDDFGVCISAWISKHYWLWFTTDLYMQMVYNPALRPTTKFLLLAQALESYHTNSSRIKSSREDVYLPSAEYKPIAKKVRNAIPESVDGLLLDNLQSRIGGANKYSLNSRLIAICELLSQYDSGAVAETVGDHAKFAIAVKELRNQLTHHPVKDYDRLAKMLQRGLRLTKSMEVLVRLCLLSELELSHQDTARLMSRLVTKSKPQLQPIW